MNFEDFLLPRQQIKTEKWQLGWAVKDDIVENGIALIFVSDFRGAGGSGVIFDFRAVRRELYTLSNLDFDLPVCDLGDLITGKSVEDTHYVLQEILTACYQKNTIPVVIGGSNDLAHALFTALSFQQDNISYTQINNKIDLEPHGEDITERNFLNKILTSKLINLKNYHHLAYQKHHNEVSSVQLMKEVDFDVVRLAEMMNSTIATEPYFRRADLVTVNCDAVESFADPFSIHPQVNGLNRREICAYMKEIGLGENLKAVGIFNYNFSSENILNQQLLAQMIWYLIEGINIQKSHPTERDFETYWVLVDDKEYAFKRDVFRNLWYFGEDENIENCIPCSLKDYEEAKKGHLNERFFKL